MTQSNEPNDRRIDRQLRTINRRVNRLEDTQVTWGELNVEFVGRRPAFGNRLYDEIDEVKIEMTQLKTEMNQRFDTLSTELNGKIDIILRHITGSGNS